MDAVPAFHALQKMRLAGVVAAVHQIDARLIDGNGVRGDQNAHVRHAGVFRNFTAVAVNAHVLHDVDENHVAVEVIHNAAGCVRHGFQKRIMIRRPEVFRHARAVNIRLAVGRCHADGQLLQCAAVAAHGMSLEVGKYQHGIIIFQIFADEIFLDDLAVRDIQLHIGAFGVQQIYREIAAPAVLVHQLTVLLGGVAGAAIGSVALHDGAADVVDHRFPELRAKEILISLFTGMQFDCNVAGERLVHQPEHIQNLLRGDNRRKINGCTHKNTFCHLVGCIIIRLIPNCKYFLPCGFLLKNADGYGIVISGEMSRKGE